MARAGDGFTNDGWLLVRASDGTEWNRQFDNSGSKVRKTSLAFW